ncbi:hypothetical protein LOR_55c12240 [Legionella oakridgensis RV-2-2007]|nr:hypothetical protein LOR_55c12240 [Legionella oakridgensis RV-2-2007]
MKRRARIVHDLTNKTYQEITTFVNEIVQRIQEG